MDSLKLVHPFTLILAGPGKSRFVKKLIENKMIKPFPKKIIWCYGVYQALYEEMPNISFHEGIPSNLHQYSDALIVIDDLMDATSKSYGYLLIDLKPETDESLRVRTADRTTWKRIRYGFITIKSTTLIGLDDPRKNTTLPAIRFVEPRRTHIPV
ncbi:uncharacterized protein TNCV_4488721 [Trichonephila clavipes]|nr:uncharacterized protein TNCV_4488721 [Trichonephila clavipes]